MRRSLPTLAGWLHCPKQPLLSRQHAAIPETLSAESVCWTAVATSIPAGRSMRQPARATASVPSAAVMRESAHAQGSLPWASCTVRKHLGAEAARHHHHKSKIPEGGAVAVMAAAIVVSVMALVPELGKVARTQALASLRPWLYSFLLLSALGTFSMKLFHASPRATSEPERPGQMSTLAGWASFLAVRGV